MRKKIFTFLLALVTSVGLSYADPVGLQVTELQVPGSWEDNPTMLSTSDMPGFVAITEVEATAWDAVPAGNVVLIFAFEGNGATSLYFKNGVYQATQAHNITYEDLYAWYSNGDKIFYTGGGSTPANSCGDGLTWELNEGVFTISYDGVGTGVMDDFDYNEHPAPWQSSKESITSVIIPDGVTRIGNNAFSGAYNLASVSMGDDVVAIGNNAFEACNSLSSITLSSHVTTIGDHAFAGLQSLTSIVLPSTVQSIGTSAFYDNQGLTSITCEGTTPPTLGQYVFGMIGNGATLYVPYGYAETYQGADSQWQALNIQVIGSGSASYPYCGDGLTWTYNDGVLTIIYDGIGTGDMLDYGNYNIYPWDSYKDDITSVIIPDGVIRIGNYAFANLTNLASVSMGDDVVEIGYGGFWNCLSIQSITLGSHVKTIGEHAFGSNEALTSITLPNTLQTIGGSAFYNCKSLPTITIPSSVTSFGEYAFGFCEGLTSFTCEGTTPPTLGQDVFTMVPYHRPLYVPDGYVETYQGADSQWQIFDISIIPAPAVDPAVQNVIDLINAIPNPVVYNQECFDALNAAHNAYVALSEEQRDQVTNYNDYVAAEERYYMLGSVNYVIEKINEIGNVEFTSACKHRIDYARSEYCNLTLEQKGYVTNYNTLLAAEAAYAALIPVSSTVVWDEDILATINVDEWDVTTFTNNTISLKAVDGHAYYVDNEQHFLLDGSSSEKSFVFSCTSANILRIEITVYEKYTDNELSCAWQETATGYRWVGEATSVDFASTIFKVTEIRFYLGEAFPEPTPTPAQDGDKLPGAFSVGGEKVVYFSKGNLQYLGNIDRWHFAENQWTIIGNAQASDNRDLFSWGTGDNPDSEDYSTYTEWGNNIEGNWRTLTVDEWTYLFNARTDASSKYGTATIAGVQGLILLPDVYDGTAINTDRTAWDNNVISSSAWAAYEAAGAVFLPAAGLSDAFGVYGVGEQGFYWSSTMDALSHDAIAVFYGFNPHEGYWFNQVDAQFQPQGRHSVRLVSETAPTPTPANPVIKLNADFSGSWADTEAFTDNGDGTASLSVTTLTAGEWYHFGVKVGDTWVSDNAAFSRENPSRAISGNGDAMWFEADLAGTYTFTWAYESNTLTIGYPSEAPSIPTVGMKGSWDDWADAVNFTDNGDGTASATKSFDHEGYYTFKTVLDGDDWRGNGYTYKRTYTGAEGITENGDNMTFWVDAKGEYTFTWTYATNAINITYPTLPTIQTKGSWDNWTDALNFTDNGDGTASVTKHFDAEGYHDFKINVGADDWRGNGENFKRDYTGAQWINENGSDMKLYVDEPGDYTFTWSYVENALSIALPAQSAREVETNEDPQDPTYYYSTFYHSANKYALPEDVEAFVADLSGSDLVLTKIAVTGQTIPSNTAVILRRANSPEDIQLIPSNAEAVTFTAHNSLQGVDMATAAPANCYVLSGTAQYGVGFYRILGSELKAHKAYVIYNGSAAPKRMRFVFNQEQTATGVESVRSSAISSQKLIENGQLIIIKNGVRYNAQGQIVK